MISRMWILPAATCFSSLYVVGAAPASHKIVWPGIDESLRSEHYSGNVPLSAANFTFPWIGTTPAVSTHYWYVESEKDPETDPIILWIQGGPGGSSIGGGFTEMGPLLLDTRSLATEQFKRSQIPTPKRNEHSWSTFSGLLMIEYADVGYSKCVGSHKCQWDDAKTSNSIVDFLVVFFTRLFLEHHGRPLWIAGESYAGILITVIAGIIDHRSKCESAFPVKLAGVLHGNGAVGHFVGGQDADAWPDGFNTNDMPDDARHHVAFFFRAGLVSERQYATVLAACPDFWRPSETCSKAMHLMKRAMGSFESRGTWWNVYNIYDTCSDMPHVGRAARRFPRYHGNLTIQREPSPEHEVSWFCGGRKVTERYMNLPRVRVAMHLPGNTSKIRWTSEKDLNWNCSQDDPRAFFHNFTTCQIQDYRPMIRQLATRYPFLVYSGDVDAQLPHTATERWTVALGFKEIEAWRPWVVNGDYVGGYVTHYEHNFTYATVKGAGHMVPQFRPEAAKELVMRFISSGSLMNQASNQHGTGIATAQIRVINRAEKLI